MDPIKKAAEILRNARHTIALTGAGISLESGIPDFRSPGGLWDRFDPAIYAHISSFHDMPTKVWEMIFEMIKIAGNAQPNPAHTALAELEKEKFLTAIITQNIDNLHQEAGSQEVIEYHGNMKKLECLSCGKVYPLEKYDLTKKEAPLCECGKILKPTVIFFGEQIPYDSMTYSQELAESTDAVIVAGTSALVYPAAGIPLVAKRRGAKVIEMNLEETGLTNQVTDVFIKGSVGKTIPKLAAELV
mgnify:CR=1 FL=1